MQVSEDVLTVLSGAKCNGNQLTIDQQLGRKLYIRVDEVLALAGGTWNRRLKAHVFDGLVEDAIEQVILSGEITRPQDFGFFESPPDVVGRAICCASIKPGQRALEPSAGRGALAFAMANAGADVTCVELLDQNRIVLTAAGFKLMAEPDFLKLTPACGEHAFDRIVMNPPFARRADIVHVQHALRFLKPDGILVAVMSAGVVFRQDKLALAFRALLEERSAPIDRLPDGSFKSSGTMVNTVLVTIPGRP